MAAAILIAIAIESTGSVEAAAANAARAAGLAVAMYIILNKTVFGYELKACGLNRFASKYAGIQEKRSIVLSLVIAGGLSGVAGGLMYLAPSNGLHINVIEVLSPQGFNGIPVALLGMSNPIGIIFSALFVAYIDQGGYYLQRLDYMPQIIDIIIAVIIYFSAFALLMRQAVGAVQSRLAKRSDENHSGQSLTAPESESESEPELSSGSELEAIQK
ncbi:hypothetical protein FACS1894184_19650 [Clostridia bacterium]|nr:hypothetical protein FACS1894184_19650 [Clostridia bacterium]